MIAILDSGIGNVGSVLNALTFLGADARIVGDAASLESAARIVFPGVGAFGPAVERLHERGLFDVVKRLALRAKSGDGAPFLGVCVGMQLFFEGSAESPGAIGLGVYAGECERFAARKVPHMGWNALEPLPAARSLRVEPGVMAYFVHSYFARECQSAALACEYEGERFVAAVEEKRLTGVQFHAEKSGAVGLSLMRSWLEST